MKKEDDLFRLVHSLEKTEKAYFKKYCSIYGSRKDHNYLRLFGFIARQEDYDEKKLLHHFRHDAFIRQLSVAKNYLFNLVLKSLESYHSSVEAELESQLHRIEILFEKGLFDICGRVLGRAKKTAEKYERHTFLLELMHWEVELARAQAYLGKSEKEMEGIFLRVFDTIEKQRNVKSYSRLVTSIFVKEVKTGFAREKSELKRYELLMRNPLLKNEKRAVTFQSKLYYYLCYIGFHSIRNEYRHALNYSRKLVEHIEAHPHQATEKPRAYLSALKNLVTCLGKLKRYSEIQAVIEKMKGIQTRSESLRNSIFYSTAIFSLETCIHTGQFSRGIKLIHDFTKRADAGALNRLNETILNYNICCICFGAGDYAAANNYLNRIVNEPHPGLRSDIHSFARILRLLIHYEMQHEDLLPYLIRSTYRYLWKRKHLYRFETVMLKFIRNKLPKTNSKKELLQAFEGLRKDLLQFAKDPFESTAFEYFDFISWLESKISGRSFAHIVQEKAAQLSAN